MPLPSVYSGLRERLRKAVHDVKPLPRERSCRGVREAENLDAFTKRNCANPMHVKIASRGCIPPANEAMHLMAALQQVLGQGVDIPFDTSPRPESRMVDGDAHGA